MPAEISKLKTEISNSLTCRLPFWPLALALAGLLGLAWALAGMGGKVPVSGLVFFGSLGLLLELLPWPLAGGASASAGLAVAFAALLALGPRPAAGLMGLAALAAGLLRRQAPLSAFSRLGASVLPVLAAGQLWQALGAGGRLQLGWVEAGRLLAAAAVLFGLHAVLSQAGQLRPGLLPKRRRLAGTGLAPGGWAQRRSQLSFAGALAALGLLLALLWQEQAPLFRGAGPLFVAAVALIPALLLSWSSRLHAEMRGTYERTLRLLGALLEARMQARRGPAPGGSQTLGHGERTARLAVAIAAALGLPPAQTDALRWAAYLHDIGKIGLPRQLLSPHEFAPPSQRRSQLRHAVIGHQILAPIAFLAEVAIIIRHHHERYDGLGYPDSKRGDDIPLGARIIAAAQEYDRLTCGRGQGLPTASGRVLAELTAGAGSRFDPEVIAALAVVLEQERDVGTSIPEEVLQTT